MQNQHVAEPFRGILNRHAYSQLAAIALCDTLEVVRAPMTCQNCGEAPGVLYDQNFPVAGGKPGFVCQRCHELCAECGESEAHLISCRFHPENLAAAENEAHEAGREERRECAELFARAIL